MNFLFLYVVTRILRSILVLLSVVFSLSLLRARFEERTWSIGYFGTVFTYSAQCLVLSGPRYASVVAQGQIPMVLLFSRP